MYKMGLGQLARRIQACEFITSTLTIKVFSNWVERSCKFVKKKKKESNIIKLLFDMFLS